MHYITISLTEYGLLYFLCGILMMAVAALLLLVARMKEQLDDLSNLPTPNPHLQLSASEVKPNDR